MRGLRAVGGFAVPAAALERLDALARAADPQAAGAIRATPQLLAELGWKPGQAEQILRGLGFARARKSGEGEVDLWRRRASPDAGAARPGRFAVRGARPVRQAGGGAPPRAPQVRPTPAAAGGANG